MLMQPQIKIMSVGVSMLHRYNTICTYFQIDVTPLYVACWKGHLDIVECLLRANADVNLQRNVRQSYLPYFWGFLTHELIFHLITPINLMCDWWPVCSNGRHQILTLQISVASHDCEMKLKSTVHFIVWVSPTVIVNTWSSSIYACFAHTFHQFQVPLPLTLKRSQKHLRCTSENWHTFTGTCATLPLQMKLWKTHKWSCTAFQKRMKLVLFGRRLLQPS